MDKLTIGGLTVKNQIFAEVTDASGFGVALKLGRIDGILGLSFPVLSTNYVPTVFQNAWEQKLVHKNEFAFYLGDSRPGMDELLLGGTDPKHYIGEFQYVPVIEKTHWEIQMSEFSVDEINFVSNGETSAIVVRYLFVAVALLQCSDLSLEPTQVRCLLSSPTRLFLPC